MQKARAGLYATLADKKLLVSPGSGPGSKEHLPDLLNTMEEPSLISTGNQWLLKVQVEVDGHPVQAMINSGAMGCYVTPEWVQQNGIKTRQKKHLYKLKLVNAISVEQIDTETEPVLLEVQGHLEVQVFDLVLMKNHTLILGKSWLTKNNLKIDWINHDILEWNQGEARSLIVRQGNRRRMWMKEVNIATEAEWLKDYKDFDQLISEDTDDKSLAQHQPWDHTIQIQDGKQLSYGPIYSMSEVKLKAVREFIKENT